MIYTPKDFGFITPGDLAAKIPGAKVFSLPDRVPDIESKNSVWTQVCAWLVEQDCDDTRRDLQDRTYVGAELMQQLRKHERKRVKKWGVSKKKLEEILAWCYVGSGPQALFCGHTISGKTLCVLPLECEKQAYAYGRSLIDRGWKTLWTEQKRKRASVQASNFYSWLMFAIDHDGYTGDLAREVRDLPDFPRTEDFYEMLSFLKTKKTVHPGALDAVEDAWLEYSETHPERIDINLRCSRCGLPGADLIWCGYQFELRHGSCPCGSCVGTCSGHEDSLSGSLLETEGLSAFRVFAAHCAVGWASDEPMFAHTLRQLNLCGLREKTGNSTSPTSTAGQIYCVRAGNNGPIKIGYTTKEINKRLASLQTSHPEKLVLLALFPGDRAKEQALHERFREHRLNGEWFTAEPVFAWLSSL